MRLLFRLYHSDGCWSFHSSSIGIIDWQNRVVASTKKINDDENVWFYYDFFPFFVAFALVFVVDDAPRLKISPLVLAPCFFVAVVAFLAAPG